MPEPIHHDRRRFLGATAVTFATAELMTGPATAATEPRPSEFKPLKQIKAGVLDIGYAEAGPADGPPVVLLHGWPYDIHTYVEVAPILAAAGRRSGPSAARRLSP